jgi:serine protease Do
MDSRPSSEARPPQFGKYANYAIAATGLASAAYASTVFALSPVPRPSVETGTEDSAGAAGDGALGIWSVADAVALASPSVAQITLTASYEASMRSLSSGGSGFIYDNVDNVYYLLTNAHVVENQRCCDECDRLEASGPAHESLHVTLPDGQTFEARLEATDTAADIAVLSFDCDHDLPVATLGESESLRPGEFVIALGSPLNLCNSCSFGIVSNVGRSQLDSPPDGTSHPGGLIQVDAAVNQGSSGGPICDLSGKVRAIVCLKLGSGDENALAVEGISFAIPISYAVQVANELRIFGRCRQPYVGLCTVSISSQIDLSCDPEFASYLPPWLDAELSTEGLLVHSVEDDSPASRAALKRGDVILAAQGKSTTTAADFMSQIAFCVDSDVKLKVRRVSGNIEYINVRPEESS